MTVPGIGPIISSAMVAAIGTGDVFSKGRDFGAWLGLVPKQISTGRPHDPRQDIEARQSLSARAVRAGGLGRAGQARRAGSATGSNPGSKPPRSGCTTTCWRSRSPTSSPASPGRFSTRARLRVRGPTMQSSDLLDPRAVLGAVKAWPGNAGASGKSSATASLDGPCARRVCTRRPGRRNGPRHEQRNCAR